ncbi:MAG: type II methionyl aminopeptidase [Candidatus Korarchaeota archaeon]|nr:type II methionyl aminopeptidase [Candidatus Korarchaeota archaeon]
MDDEQLEAYIKLGELHSSILKSIAENIRPGVKVLEIVERSEEAVIREGYKLAFPTNLSINEVAAHYTPHPSDETVVPEGAVVKLDMGSHFNGLIVDAARSITLDERYEEMVQVAKDALDKAIEKMIPGNKIREASEAIYETIVSAGYRPIHNLTGHKIEEFRLHAGVDVPNVPVRGKRYRIKEGDVFAIEPFVTLPEARGLVAPAGDPLIFSFRKKVRTRDEMERKVIKLIEKGYNKLPFCERWLARELGHRVNHALLRLVKRGALISYPPLVEITGKVVAQYEDTVLVTADGPLRLTGE